MKKPLVPTLLAAMLLSSSTAAWSCPYCRPLVKAGVYAQNFTSNLLVLLLPIAVLAVIGVGIYYFADRIFAFGPTSIKEPQIKAAQSEGDVG
jgi:hypothetical protein